MHNGHKIAQLVRREAELVISDGDKTLWKGNAAERGIALGYLRETLRGRELARHPIRPLRFMGDGLAIKRAVRRNERDGVSLGLKRLYDSMVRNGMGDDEDMFYFARRYIQANAVKQTLGLMLELQPMPVFISSMNGSMVCEAAVSYLDHLGLKTAGFASNTDRFGKIRQGISRELEGIDVCMVDGTTKLDATERKLHELGLPPVRRSAVIGDSEGDVALMEEASVSIASPYATEEVRRIAKVHMDGVKRETSMFVLCPIPKPLFK
ncbi:MAG: HAD hydrolase family protein [Candidatus Micrarchaeota archaeon]|nr:HAD hydrolase family protein [Candidatus Micrarchaeota archaeon]